jgi:hypothetical protein
MHQEFDWIRLTKVPAVMQGANFPIQVSMNKSPDAIQSITFYYTTNVNHPKQNLAEGSIVVPEAAQDTRVQKLEAAHQVFLPVVNRNYAPPIELPPVENEIQFVWHTASVVPGEYHICAVSTDGYNMTTFCSEAPVKVLP